MTLPGRKPIGLKAAAATLGVLGLMLGIWAGTRVHTNHPAAKDEMPMSVPVGEASPPTAGDVDADVEATPHAAAKIPERLPDFTLNDRNGRPTPVSTWTGKSLVLNFWATWCAPCRREIPLLKTLATDWQHRGIEVVGIAVDHRDKVAAYADELKMSYPILIGEQDALDLAAQFGVDSPVFPFTVFTDRRSRVVTLYIGELHKAQADLILLAVQNINDDRLDLAQARHDIASGLRALNAAPQSGR